MSEPVGILRITRSQQMALIDILTYHASRKDEVQVFVNCSVQPIIETTTGELLTLLLLGVRDWSAPDATT